jgi:hypothetical protein
MAVPGTFVANARLDPMCHLRRTTVPAASAAAYRSGRSSTAVSPYSYLASPLPGSFQAGQGKGWEFDNFAVGF